MGGTPRHTGADKNAQSWTAMRCRRLLRPLQSRLAALRKLSPAGRVPPLPAQPPRANAISSKLKRARAGNETVSETAGARKKQRRTYSQKGSIGGKALDVAASRAGKMREFVPSKKPRPDGLPSIATPLLRRTKSPLEYCRRGTPSRSFTALADEPRDEALTRSLSLLLDMQVELGVEQHGICEGILRALAALVLATTSHTTITAPKSLVSMCLRQIPKYLARADEEEMLDAKNDDSLTAFSSTRPSIRIYDELEALGSGSCGWKGLQTLVRAHALSVLKEAIVTGLFTPNFAGILVNYYQQAGQPEDCWELADALLRRKYPGPQNPRSTLKEIEELRPLAMLSGLAARPSNARHVSRAISSLVESKQLPVAWLSTRALQFFWVLSAGSLLDSCTSSHCLQSLTVGITSLSLSCRQSDSHYSIHQPTQALTAVIGAMTAMALVSGGSFHSTGKGDAVRQGRTLVQSRVLHVFQAALLGTAGRDADDKAHDMLRLGIYFITMSINGCDLTRKLVEGAGDLSRSTHQLGEMAIGLTCNVARCSSKAISTPPNRIYSWLFDQLEALQLPDIKKLRRDGAFMLARETDDLRDLAFAENEQPNATTPIKASPAQTTRRQSTFTGYRWEEGISEWVVASPAKLNKAAEGSCEAGLATLAQGTPGWPHHNSTSSSNRAPRTARHSCDKTEVAEMSVRKVRSQAAEGQAQQIQRETRALTLGPERQEVPTQLQRMGYPRRSSTAEQENRTSAKVARRKAAGVAAPRRGMFRAMGWRVALADVQMGQAISESDDELSIC